MSPCTLPTLAVPSLGACNAGGFVYMVISHAKGSACSPSSRFKHAHRSIFASIFMLAPRGPPSIWWTPVDTLEAQTRYSARSVSLLSCIGCCESGTDNKSSGGTGFLNIYKMMVSESRDDALFMCATRYRTGGSCSLVQILPRVELSMFRTSTPCRDTYLALHHLQLELPELGQIRGRCQIRCDPLRYVGRPVQILHEWFLFVLVRTEPELDGIQNPCSVMGVVPFQPPSDS